MHLTAALDALCADLTDRGIRYTRTPTLVRVLLGATVQSIVIAMRDDGRWSAAPSTFGHAAQDTDPLLAIRRVALDLHRRASSDRNQDALQALLDALGDPPTDPEPCQPAVTRAELLDLLRRADLIIAGLLVACEKAGLDAGGVDVEKWISDSRGPIAEACGKTAEGGGQ